MRIVTRPFPDHRWLYGALATLGAIVSHLCAEFAGMGDDSAEVTFSRRHIYLGVAAVIALVVIVRELSTLLASAANRRDAKRLAEIGLASLPMGGQRGFFWVTTALQLTIGGMTEIGEGCPLCGHDIAAGVAGAIFGALLMAIAVRLLARRLPSVACALVDYLRHCTTGAPATARRSAPPVTAFEELLWFARLRNRPPPLLQTA